ncbi:MAG: elongation factor G [Planctomycetota bacterium]|nr:elongation factor G [Planctomycetota bacterium]
MAEVQTEAIRNVVLVGNSGAGKTQLAEAMLHAAGVTTRLGTPQEGNTVSDFEPVEKDRQTSIFTSVMNLKWKGAHVNLLDAPGYADFIGAGLWAMHAADTAVLVVSAAAGVDIHTQRYFQIATDQKMARVIVVNRSDAENVDLERVVGQIREALGPQCRLMSVPVGQGPAFKGVVNAFDKAEGAEALMDVATAHGELVESIVEADEALMERYLGDEKLAPEEIAGAFTKALQAGTVVPILFAGARKEIGVTELLDLLVAFTPNPKQARPRTARKGAAADAPEVTMTSDPKGPLVAQVFKVVADPYVGKVSYLRVFSGTLLADSPARIGDERRDTKIGHVLRVQGKETQSVSQAAAGDIVGVAKVDELSIGRTVSSGAEPLFMAEPAMPVPMYSLALQPKTRGDEQKISECLAKVLEEDTTLKTTRDRQTNELVVSGMGDIHLTTLLARLRRRYQLEVDTKPPKIPYRETISATADGHYRHKKQTGGAGQFGEVYVRVEPKERGAGFEFVDDTFGGSIPKQFLPAVEKGVREALEQGVIAGYPFSDVLVAATDGKSHAVDSKEVAFKIAGRMAFKDAVLKAKPVILEPYVNLAVTVPDEYLGAITGDLNSRRGRIMGMEAGAGGSQTIKVQVPLAEVAQYNTQLRSITGGQGTYTMELSHYEPVPPYVQQTIIDSAAKAKEEEE